MVRIGASVEEAANKLEDVKAPGKERTEGLGTSRQWAAF